jgi:ABC-type polysaccharide/polyol phosphate transport system ATPase subunit
MLPEGTIATEHLWKRFRADRRRMLLRDEIERLRARLRGGGAIGWRWALRDINLRAEPGESIGLVGVNGSGKTTLLKVLSRVMYPYAGRVEVSGRVGALIEVRAGIHPDLTGRENISVTGSLLGLPRKEVARRFDEIVAFAELEDSVDRQVKFYSSGMQMRLGFAVAAFLEPAVLLVDEALAVGDATFQQKCLDRMRAVLAQGTTLVFVSHDLAAVEATCGRGVWLHNGSLRADGPVREVLGQYRRSIEEAAESSKQVEGLVRLVKAEVEGADGSTPRTQQPLILRSVIESSLPRSGRVFIGISDGPATPIFVVRRDAHLIEGETEVTCEIARLPLPRGRFYVWAGVYDSTGHELLPWHPLTHVDVSGPDLDDAPRAIARPVPVHVDAAWRIEAR